MCMSCSFLPGRWSAPRQSDCYGSLERASEQRGTLSARSLHTGNRESKRVLNGRAQQEAWPSITMLVGRCVLPTHSCFRRPGDNHGVTRPRQAGPGSVHPWPRREEQKRADRGSAAGVLGEDVRDCAKGVACRELLGAPGIGGMTRYGDIDDFSALEFDDKEGKERAKEEIRDGQEVARPDLMRVVVQEDAPGLRSRTCRLVVHVLLNGTFGDVDAQFEQLPADALSSPQAIVQRHCFDQRDGLGSDFGFR